METVILPGLSVMSPSNVLFVGVAKYTAHYAQWFQNATWYRTIDLRREMARYGSKNNHIICDIVRVNEHFHGILFDVVILNGVFGWGLDKVEDQEKALKAIRQILKTGGVLLIGWNVDRVKDPLALEGIKQYFRHSSIGSIPARKVFQDSTHVYDLFVAGNQA